MKGSLDVPKQYIRTRNTMKICSCCYDPVVYPENISDSLVPTMIVVHDDLPTFEGEKDWTHSMTTRVSHVHLEKLGMQYKEAFDKKYGEDNKMWHLPEPDGRVISAGALSKGVSWCLIREGRVEAM